MATRSLICAKFNNPEFEPGVAVAYCHYDGYIDYNGKILVENYNSLEDAFALANIGYFSSLSENMEDNLNPEKHANECEPDFFNSMAEVFEEAESDYGVEYVYYFDQYWYVWDIRADRVSVLETYDFKVN